MLLHDIKDTDKDLLRTYKYVAFNNSLIRNCFSDLSDLIKRVDQLKQSYTEWTVLRRFNDIYLSDSLDHLAHQFIYICYHDDSYYTRTFYDISDLLDWYINIADHSFDWQVEILWGEDFDISIYMDDFLVGVFNGRLSV